MARIAGVNAGLVVALGPVSLGLLFAGCSGGGGGSSASGTTSLGIVSSGLTSPNRDPAGYDFLTTSLNQIADSTATSVGVAAVGTDLLAGAEPTHEVSLIGQAGASLDSTFTARVVGIAALDSDVFAATADVSSGSARQGDVFRRVGAGQWQAVIDSDHDGAAVARVGSRVVAATGGVGAIGQVHVWSAQGGSFAVVAPLESSVTPTAVGGTSTQIYVGGTSPTGARLYRITDRPVSVNLPTLGQGPGQREEVSALLAVGLVRQQTQTQTTTPTTTTPTTTAPVSSGQLFYDDVSPTLAARCSSCHASPQNAAFLSFRLTPTANGESDYRRVLARLNLQNPPESPLLRSGAGLDGHPGSFLSSGEPQYNQLLEWIRQSAPARPGSMGAPGNTGTGTTGTGTGTTTPTNNPTPDPAAGEALVVAVAVWDAANQGVGGLVAVTRNGTDFEVLRSFSGEAPTGLAFADNTIYVSTSAGKLQWRDGSGAWVDETGLPQNRGVFALAAPDGARLALACRGAQGALVIQRFARGGGGNTGGGNNGGGNNGGGNNGGGGGTPTFAANVRPALQARCNVCHTNTGIVGNAFLLSGNDTTDAALARGLSDTASPDNSVLLIKATGGMGHGGGATITNTSAEYTQIRAWIAAGAP